MIWRTGASVLVGLLLAHVAARAQTAPAPQRAGPAGNPQYAPAAGPQYAPATNPQHGHSSNPQYGPSSAPTPQAPPARPDQPVLPRDPRLEQRPSPRAAAPARAAQPPFRISPEHEAYLNRVLVAWEQRGAQVKTFECGFARFEYDGVWGSANEPVHVDAGRLKYKAPDQGVFEVTHTRRAGEWQAIDENRKEHWVCDGKSIYQFDYQKKQLIERQLPAELQGQAISNGPLPFLFGAKAAELKDRYWMRVITPAQVQDTQIWLEAYPRHRADAAEFKRAEVILSMSDLTMQGLRVDSPNDKSWKTFRFEDINVNERRGPFGFLRSDPFRAQTPLGWKKIVEPPPTDSPPAQIGRGPTGRETR